MSGGLADSRVLIVAGGPLLASSPKAIGGCTQEGLCYPLCGMSATFGVPSAMHNPTPAG